VTIEREDRGFRIIIPKSYYYGKADLKRINPTEFNDNYHSYRIKMKDIIQLIKDQSGIDQNEFLTKE